MSTPALVTYAIHSDVAVITIDNPPVNAFSPPVIEALLARLAEAQADAKVQAIVLIGAGKTFSAGADITEFLKYASGEKPFDDGLHRLIFAAEDSNKPVVVALRGTALGGAVELSVGCHYRIADSRTQLGLPEVKLGLIPGAMGTQRLPRLCGIAKAAEMCATGRMCGAAEALESGIIDRVTSEDLLPAAIDFAREMAATPVPLRKTRDMSDRLGEATENKIALEKLSRLVSQKARGQIAPQKAIEAVGLAATLPFAEAIKRESEMFQELLLGDQSRALVHVFFGERAVAKIPNIAADTPSRQINTAAVVGAGTMGSGIAMTYLAAGIPVVLKEVDAEQLQRGVETIRKQLAASAERGRITQGQAEQQLALLTPTLDYQDLSKADVIVEAVFEAMHLKQEVFAELDRVAKPSAILATNTSTLDIDQIASATSRPESVIGHHFFSPANIMRLLEIVRGNATSDEVIVTSMGLAKRLSKVAVLVGNCFGFVGNRMFWPYQREAQFLLEEGASVEQVDRVLADFGMAMGPNAVMDLAGIDVGWRVDQERKGSLPAGLRQPLVSSKLYELNRYGQKTGAGWYRYEGRQAHSDPTVQTLIESTAQAAGIERRTISDTEILERTLYALINEGARILAEGIAQRPVDIDITYVYGYGFPAWRGGPMMFADTEGLKKIYERTCHYHKLHGSWWEPAPLLEELAKGDGKFADLAQRKR